MSANASSSFKRKKARQLLPEELRKPRKKRITEEEREILFKKLLEHYDLAEPNTTLWETQRGPQKLRLALLFYRALAERLLRDFIPAFGKHAGRPSRFPQSNIDDWIKAGGGLLSWPADMTRFYQAQFVDVIRRLADEKRKPQGWILDWLTEGTGREAERRRNLLPEAFRGIGKKSSLRQAFKAIPRDIRDNPSKYLPPRTKTQSHPAFLEEMLSKLGLPTPPKISAKEVRGLF